MNQQLDLENIRAKREAFVGAYTEARIHRAENVSFVKVDVDKAINKEAENSLLMASKKVDSLPMLTEALGDIPVLTEVLDDIPILTEALDDIPLLTLTIQNELTSAKA